MFREKIPSGQLSAWLFGATVPVLIQLLGGSTWVWVAVACAAALAVTLLLRGKEWQLRKWQCAFLFVYSVALLSQLLYPAARSWPAGESDLAVALILLLLASWSARKGISSAARVGATLFWIVLLFYAVILWKGTQAVSLSWLKPSWDAPDVLGLTVLLVPTCAVCLLGDTGAKGKLFLPPLFITAAALITAGVLSPGVAGNTENAFYEMSRSLRWLDNTIRFEPLISAGMTVGWFALMSLLLTICASLCQKMLEGGGRAGVWIAASAAAVCRLCGLHIDGRILLGGATVFWVVMPILTQGLDRRKKS